MVTVFKAKEEGAAFRAAQRGRVAVNGVVIAPSDIARETQAHPGGSPLEAWQAAARALALRELLLQEARAQAITAEPLVDAEGRRETEDEALMRTLVAQQVVTPAPDAASCRRYYDANVVKFRSSDIFEAAHILLVARPEAADPLDDARVAAARLLAMLADAPDTFADLAKRHSACPSAQSGGNLGQITTGDTTPAFEAALMALTPGETTRQAVETPYGLHIIRLDRKIDGAILPFEVVHTRIADYLAARSERQAIAQYLARLVATADVEGVAFPTPADLRVSG